MVELETDCLTVTSGATSAGPPEVTDWVDDTSTNTGNINWP
jgi:hypothetical protein